MAITTTALGPNSVQITASNFTSNFNDLYTAIKTAITAPGTGWTLHDEFQGNGGFNPSGTLYTAGDFEIGQLYVIKTLGDTDFTLIGADSNTVGISFTATGVGTGTGTASTGYLGVGTAAVVNATAMAANTWYQILTVGTSVFTSFGAAANTVGTIFTATGPATGTGTVVKYDGVYTTGSFQVGTPYLIQSVGTTDFTTIGAVANKVGLRFTATAAGTGTGTANIPYDAYGTLQTAVFKALNADGVTYKYAIFRFNIPNGTLDTSTCESWNKYTHTAVNEVYTYLNCSTVYFRLDATDIILFINPRWLFAHSYINNEPGQWSGIVEMAREDAADTVAKNVPCWGWIGCNLGAINSSWMSNSNSPAGSGCHSLITVPRTASGDTGYAAACKWSADYGVTQHPTFTITSSAAFSFYIGVGNRFQVTAWDPSKRAVFSIKPIYNYAAANTVQVYGQIFGLKTLAPSGKNMDRIKLSIDDSGNYQVNGASRDHFLLNQYHVPCDFASSGFFAPHWKYRDVSLGVSMASKPIMIGGTFYFSGQDALIYKVTPAGGVIKLNLNINKAWSFPSYDGEFYIYTAAASSVARIDIRDDSITYINGLPGAAAWGRVAITGQHVCVSMNIAASGSNGLVKIFRNSFQPDVWLRQEYKNLPGQEPQYCVHSNGYGTLYLTYMVPAMATFMNSALPIQRLSPFGVNLGMYNVNTQNNQSTSSNVWIEPITHDKFIATVVHGANYLQNAAYPERYILALFSNESNSPSYIYQTITTGAAVDVMHPGHNLFKYRGQFLFSWIKGFASGTVNDAYAAIIPQISASEIYQMASPNPSTFNPSIIGTMTGYRTFTTDGSTVLFSANGNLKICTGCNDTQQNTAGTLGQMALPA